MTSKQAMNELRKRWPTLSFALWHHSHRKGEIKEEISILIFPREHGGQLACFNFDGCESKGWEKLYNEVVEYIDRTMKEKK